MKKALWLALLVLLLTGCDGGTSGVDLYELEAGGQATASAAQARLRATQSAAFERQAQATMAAAATQGAAQVELELLRGRLEATRQAQEMALQSSGATEAARQAQYWQEATRQAHELRTTAEAMGARATQTVTALELEREVRTAVRREMQDELLGSWLPLIGLAVVIGGIGLFFSLAIRASDWFLEWRDRKMRLFETRHGTVAWYPGEDGFWEPRLLAAGPSNAKYAAPYTRQLRAQNESEAEVVALTPSGSVLSSRMESKPEPGVTGLAVVFLREAAVIVGEDADTIPGWRKLGWSSERWQRVVAALEAVGAVETRPGVGTLITDDFQDLGNLLYQVETRQVRIRPVR